MKIFRAHFWHWINTVSFLEMFNVLKGMYGDVSLLTECLLYGMCSAEFIRIYYILVD